jgi:hypothetical protein
MQLSVGGDGIGININRGEKKNYHQNIGTVVYRPNLDLLSDLFYSTTKFDVISIKIITISTYFSYSVKKIRIGISGPYKNTQKSLC